LKAGEAALEFVPTEHRLDRGHPRRVGLPPKLELLFAFSDAFADTFVPSIAITPTFTNPAFAHTPR